METLFIYFNFIGAFTSKRTKLVFSSSSYCSSPANVSSAQSLVPGVVWYWAWTNTGCEWRSLILGCPCSTVEALGVTETQAIPSGAPSELVSLFFCLEQSPSLPEEAKHCVEVLRLLTSHVLDGAAEQLCRAVAAPCPAAILPWLPWVLEIEIGTLRASGMPSQAMHSYNNVTFISQPHQRDLQATARRPS